MRENKLHISNKSFVAIKISLLAAVLIGLVIFIASVVPTIANGPVATIWTTDSTGNDKTDFGPGEIVSIHGNGFNPFSQIDITVTRPDFVTETCNAVSCYPRFLNGLQTSDIEGTFVYQYNLNGIQGTYTVDANDGTNSAQTIFTDDIKCSNIACSNNDPCYNRCDGSYWYSGTPNTCSQSLCPGYCLYDNRVCADADSNDGYPSQGGSVRTCSATCDQDSDCLNGGCSGTQTFLGDCKNNCTCGTQAACVKDSCGAVCGSDSDCDCLGYKHSSHRHCYSNCSCNYVNAPVCTVGECGAQCDATHACPEGQTCNNDCQCVGTTPPEICNDEIDNDGDGYTDCADPDCKPCITIVADKIVCNSEDDLPNWSGTSTYIDANTAQNYVNAHPNDCGLAPDWYFQWSFGGANPGDNLEYAPGWNTFGPTNANGRTSVVISKADSSLWFREALKLGYLQFTGVGGSDVTAEFYCDGDVLNYDNYDNLDSQSIIDGDTFYCVAFNVKSCTSNSDCSSLNTACADGFCNAQNLCEQQFKSDQTVCGPSQGLCDLEEKCTGSSAVCPDDVKSTAVCRDIAGDCDEAEYCDGRSNDCPADSFLPDTVECRASAGECDLEEKCTGSSAACPDDVKSTAVCKSAVDVCDVAEFCDGINDVCPVDEKSPLSTPCDDGLWCSATDHCDGSGNCVKLTDRDCSANNTCGVATCDNNPDDYHPTWDFRDAFTSVCDENTDSCTQGDTTITHTCDKTQCGAECDAQNPCNNKCISNVFYSNGQCQGDCTCYYSQQNCDDQIACTIDSCDPVTGCSHTPDNSVCDDNDPCTIDVCDVNRGCVNTFSDTIGPVTSNVIVDPYYNNGNFNTTALTTDVCSNIKKSEYFVGHGLGSCGFAGTGTSMDVTDGNFDEKVEDIKKNNVQYFFDGLNYICIQSQDVANNWGNCECAYYETDIIPPDCPTDIYMDNQLYPDEYLICGNNAWLNASVCDQESKIQGGEYFIDKTIPPIPAPWSGYWMDTLYNFTRVDSWKCGVIGALVDTSQLEDGTHYIKIRGKDTAENWGKISECSVVSFIRDTTAPVTTKQLNPTNGNKVDCDITQMNGQTITDGCYYVKQGTTVTLTATDPDPQGTGEHADNVLIHYKIYWSYDGISWTPDTEGQSVVNQPITLNLTKDSYHLIEYWSTDGCNWEETHHFELDIVDTVSPVTTKTVGEPKLQGSGFDYWITQQTPITLSCSDQDPHPVDHVTLYAKYKVDDGNWVDLTTSNGYVQFTFPEDSIHTLEYYCVDELGNTESTQIEIDKVDTTPPETTKTYGQPLVETDGGYPKWITSQTPIYMSSIDGGQICAVGVDKTYWRNTLVDEIYCADQSLCQEAEPVQPNLVINEIYYDTVGSDYDSFIELFGPANFDLDGYKVVGINGANGLEYNPIILDGYETDENGFFLITMPSSIYVGIADMVTPAADFQNGPDAVKLVKTGGPDIIVDLLGYGPLGNPAYFETLPAQDVIPGQSLSRNEMHTDTNNNAVDFTAGTPTPKSGNPASKWNEYLEPFYKPEESCHLIEYYSVDILGNKEPIKKQCVYVENTPPEIVKTVDTPKHECTVDEKTQYGNPDYGCWYITQNTKITLDCDDVMPHPVDNVVLYYRDYLIGQTAPSYTAVPGGYVDIYKTEDSEHVLEFYCVDALGNSQGTAENPHKEIDIVDTQAPNSSKALGEPKHVCTETEAMEYYQTGIPSDGCYFITQNTPITLTCTDGQPHPVDHVEIWYRDYLVGEEAPRWTVVENDNVTFNKTEDSAHILEWYCVDELGNNETTHVEYDIVDTQKPNLIKTIVGPQHGDCPPQSMDDNCFIDGVTQIHVESTDLDPHPSDHVTCDWDYTVTDGTKIGTGQTNVVPPFDINFPEESTHILTITCKDILGNEETDVEKFIVDKTPPTTTKTYGTPLVEAVTGGYPKWITSQTPITLTVNDTGIHKSGIKETKYRVTLLGSNDPCESDSVCQQQTGSGDWNAYTTTPFTIGQESCHLIEYYSVDNVNKTEIIKKQCVYVDNTPPEVSKEVGDPKHACEAGENCDLYITSQTPITLTCTDQIPHPVNRVNIYYRYYIDGETQPTFTQESSQVTFYIPEDSRHVVEYYCVDALGNTNGTDQTPYSEIDVVDNKAPTSSKIFDGINIPCSQLNCSNETVCDNYITQDTKIVLSCSDQDPHPVDHQKIYYRYFVDDVLHQDWTEYTAPIQYDEDSKHTLEWFCNDSLSNTEQTHTQIERVDTEAPNTTKTVGDPKWGENDYWVTSNTPITLTTVDKEYPCASGHTTLYFEDWYDSNCDNVVDSLVNSDTIYTDQDCKLGTTIYLNGECLHTLKWYAVDALGNTEQLHTQDHKVDDTPPHVLILKPVDGWYSEGEDMPIATLVEDLDGKKSPCGHDCNPLGKECAVGIEDGTQCYAYLLDILPESRIVQLNTEGTFMYNADAKECQGYATIPEGSEIPDGVTILVVRAKDNLGNEAGSLAEILRAVFERCGCDVYDMCAPKCVADVMQDIVTIWNLPKIGIDNHAPEVNITTPEEGTLFGGEQVYFSADVIDSNDGDVTSTITSGTPCYVTIGGISLGIVPYSNVDRKCSGTIIIPQDTDFPQGTHALKVEIADNAGNLGSDTVNVNVDTVVPTLSIIIPAQNQFVKGSLQVTAQVDDANLDASSIKISTDNGQTWKDVWYCNPSTYCYDWDTTTETDGMAYGIIARATDFADNTGYSEEVIVIVDNGAPEGVYVLNPIKDDIVQGTITLKALATDYVSGIDNVKIYVSSVVWDCNATLIDGTWQCNLDSTSFPDGVHHAYAVATDNVGKQTTSTNVPFIIDNNSPTTPSDLIHIPSGNYVTQNSVTWKWQVSSDSGSGLDHYIIDIDGIGYTVSTSPESGYESYTINLLEGAHTAKVKSFDKAGHASEWSNTDSLTIDTISPSALTIYGTNIENPIYDTNGNYNINWNGGTDTNFDRYELYEDGTLAYTGISNVLSRSSMSEGSHEYQVKAYDAAGHETISSFFDVFVDTITPIITENSQSSWGPIGWWFDYSIDDGVKSSGLLTPTYSGGLNLCSFNSDTKTGSCLVFGNANITIHVEDNAGHSAQLTVEKGSEIKTDFTPPELLASGPSGVINYNKINLTATTNEPSVCKYGIDDDYSTMVEMSGSGTTSHLVDLGTLTDGLKVYHVMCEDMAGNKMDSSKTVVFYIDTSGSYNLSIPDYGHYWSTGWNTFFLPKRMLDDICGSSGTYPVANVLTSLYNGGGAKFNIIWYFNGTDWKVFDPDYPEYSTLKLFDDQQSLPYYIYMNIEDRLEITTANCGSLPS